MKSLLFFWIIWVSILFIVWCEQQPRPTASNPAPWFERVSSAAWEAVIDEDTSSNAEDEDQWINTEWTNLPEIIVDDSIELPVNQWEEIEYDEAEQILEDANNVDDIDDLWQQEEIIVPNSVNLDIPFYAQAPDGDRSLPWKEACEEASIILARYYLADERLTKATFKDEVLQMVELQESIFGKYIDTSVEETQRLYEEFYEWFGETKIIENPTIEQLKIELAQWHPIIAPFAWRELGNSNFTWWGPRYHKLVIRWYDEQYFYTNDVGTRRGDNFPYTYETIMDALHDLIPDGEGDIRDGDKRVLVLMND